MRDRLLECRLRGMRVYVRCMHIRVGKEGLVATTRRWWQEVRRVAVGTSPTSAAPPASKPSSLRAESKGVAAHPITAANRGTEARHGRALGR